MATTTLTRSRARSLTIAAQAGVVVLGAGALLVAAKGLPGGDEPPVERVSIEDLSRQSGAGAEEPGQAAPAQHPPDYEGIAVRFASIKNAPQPPAEETPTEPVASEPAETPSTAPGVEVRYLGMVREPDRSLALLSVDGRQKIVPEGGVFTAGAGGEGEPTDLRVIRVRDGEALIELDGERQRFTKASRAGSGVTVVTGAAPAPRIETPAPDQNEEARRMAIEAARGVAGEQRDYLAIQEQNIQRRLAEGDITEDVAKMQLERIQRLRERRQQRQNGQDE